MSGGSAFEDDYRRQFLTDGDFAPPPREYWAVVFADDGQEWRFAYDPIVHGPLNPVLRVALVAGAVGEPNEPYDQGVEETATGGARPPGANWEPHCRFCTVVTSELYEADDETKKRCVGSDPSCEGSLEAFRGWVAWRRVEVHYAHEFYDPDDFEEYVRHVREDAREYKRGRFKVVSSEEEDKQ